MEDAASTSPAAQTTFVQANGVNGTTHEEEEAAPAPPPHKSSSSPPPETPAPTVDAEAFKTAGNKFFKAREWQKAVQEYTKG